MHYSNIILLVVAVLNLFLSIFVLLKNAKKRVNIYFGITVFAIAFWCLTIVLFRTATINTVFLWGQVVYLGFNFTTIFFLYFTFVFPSGKFPSNKLIRFLLISAPLAIFFVTLVPNSVIKDALVENGNIVIDLNWGYYIHSAFTLVAFLWAFINLARKFKESLGVQKQQLVYLFIGTGITTVLGITTNLILFFWTTEYNWIGPAGTIIMVAFIAYAITRYRLMDVRLIVARTIAFGAIVLILATIFSLASTIIARLFSDLIGSGSDVVSAIIISILIVLGYKPIVNLVEKSTNKFLFKQTYNSDELLSTISDIAARFIQIDKLSKALHQELDSAFHFEKFAIAMLNQKAELDIIYQHGFKTGIAEGLAAYPNVGAIFAKELELTPGLLVIDEMKTKYDNGEFEPVDPKLLGAFHDNNIAVAVPLYVKDNLIGVMVLGDKKSGDAYSHQDIKAIEIIGGQVAVAIDNARLYEELRYFNLKLEKEVEDKTKQLRKANVDLKKLDQAKSEFISIASHQLRTPLTVIKGYISMMQEGSFGPVNKPIKANLDKVYVSNERLIQLVENLLDISRIESGRQEFIWKKIQLEDLAAEVTEKLQDSAKKKKLKLTFHQPEQKLPATVVDDGKIHEVMMNFVDNAIKYTETGSVDVYIKQEPKGMLTFCVKDTGKGMSEEGKTKLFKKFSRGKDSFRQHTEGLGLGLYVATMMMRAHEGRIWADSPGEGKGSSFCFSVPTPGKHKDGDTSKIDEEIVGKAQGQEQKEAKENVKILQKPKRVKK